MKMKRRIFTLALVALLALSGLWAVDSQTANVDLTLNLIGDTVIGWFPGDSEPTLGNWDSTKLADDSDQAFENNALDTIELWAAVKSNENVQLRMEVSGEHLTSSTAATTPIAITATPRSGFDSVEAVEWNGDGDASKTLVKQEDAKVNESRVLAAEVTFRMDAQDYNSALSAGDYSADITLTVTAV